MSNPLAAMTEHDTVRLEGIAHFLKVAILSGLARKVGNHNGVLQMEKSGDHADARSKGTAAVVTTSRNMLGDNVN